MDDERRATHEVQTAARLETDAGVHEARVRGVAAVELLPAAVRSEQLRVVGVVVLGRERQQRHGLLEREEAEVAVDPAEHLELFAQEIVHLAPRPRVEHAAGEVGALDRDLLRHAGAHADQTDEVNLLQAEMIEQPDGVIRVQRHGGRHGQVVTGIADAAVIEQDHLVAVDESARQMVMVLVAEGAPAAHAQHRVALTEHLVVHVVAVDVGDGHGISGSTGQNGLATPMKAISASSR